MLGSPEKENIHYYLENTTVFCRFPGNNCYWIDFKSRRFFRNLDVFFDDVVPISTGSETSFIFLH